MKKIYIVLVVSFLFLVVGCKGGGGGGGAAITPPSQSLTGTYTLVAFEVSGGGQTFTDANVSGDWGGEMKIALDEFFQKIHFNGDEFTYEGSYVLTWENAAHTSATLDIYDEFGFPDGQVFIDIVGNEVIAATLFMDNGILYSEEDTWKKVSDKV